MKINFLPRTTRNIINILFLSLFFIPCSLLPALDFGLILNNYASYGNIADKDGHFEYKGNAVPMFSALIGDNSGLFISAGVAIDYNKYSNFDDTIIVPELLRTEFFTKINALEIKAGRTSYSDPLGGLIAHGLFDGAHLSYASSETGRIGFGVFYTGLLYKKSANITMTQDDKGLYDAKLDFDKFSDTYFAPRRLILAADWEHPSLFQLIRFNANLTAQFDLTDGITSTINSQYLVLKAGIRTGSFLFEAGGAGSLQQISAAEDLIKTAFAGDFALHFLPRTSFSNRLTLSYTAANGTVEDNSEIGAFVPITTKYYAEIFQAKMSSLSVINLSYSARVSEPLGFNIKAAYFMRHDLVSNNYYIITETGENESLLGAEIFARIIFSPFSDLQFNIGGGAFLPSLGNVWPNEKPKFRADISMVMSL